MAAQSIQLSELVRMLATYAPEKRLHDVLATASEELIVKPIPKRELLEIYGRRRLQIPDSHPMSAGVNRLLAALTGYDGDNVSVVTVESQQVVFTAWLTERADAVLATLVGDNSR